MRQTAMKTIISHEYIKYINPGKVRFNLIIYTPRKLKIRWHKRFCGEWSWHVNRKPTHTFRKPKLIQTNRAMGMRTWRRENKDRKDVSRPYPYIFDQICIWNCIIMQNLHKWICCVIQFSSSDISNTWQYYLGSFGFIQFLFAINFSLSTLNCFFILQRRCITGFSCPNSVISLVLLQLLTATLNKCLQYISRYIWSLQKL